MEHEKSRCVFSRGAPEKIGTRGVIARKFGLDRAAPGHRSATAVSDRRHKIDILPHGIIFVRREFLAFSDVTLHFLRAPPVQAVA